jgi:hypothetical protein
MGHVRLGSPPASRKWQQVVDLLGAQMLLKFASSRQIFGSRL